MELDVTEKGLLTEFLFQFSSFSEEDIEAQKEKVQKEGIKVINNTVDLKIYQYREEK